MGASPSPLPPLEFRPYPLSPIASPLSPIPSPSPLSPIPSRLSPLASRLSPIPRPYWSTTRCPSLSPLSTCVFVPLLTPTFTGRRSRWFLAPGR